MFFQLGDLFLRDPLQSYGDGVQVILGQVPFAGFKRGVQFGWMGVAAGVPQGVTAGELIFILGPLLQHPGEGGSPHAGKGGIDFG